MNPFQNSPEIVHRLPGYLRYVAMLTSIELMPWTPFHVQLDFLETPYFRQTTREVRIAVVENSLYDVVNILTYWSTNRFKRQELVKPKAWNTSRRVLNWNWFQPSLISVVSTPKLGWNLHGRDFPARQLPFPFKSRLIEGIPCVLDFRNPYTEQVGFFLGGLKCYLRSEKVVSFRNRIED